MLLPSEGRKGEEEDDEEELNNDDRDCGLFLNLSFFFFSLRSPLPFTNERANAAVVELL
jgi:hypothetical protein